MFFAGVIVILVWRILEHFVGCGWAAAVRGRSRSTTHDDDAETTANLGTRIKWKCEKLVSGQTLVGRIVVSCIMIVLH